MTMHSHVRAGRRPAVLNKLLRRSAIGRNVGYAARPSLRRLFTDRRGATAVLFGISATVVIGMVGLGTEGGTWYLTKRDAQNAADTAAYAGATRLAFAQGQLAAALGSAQSQARTAATETSTRNGFTSGQASTTVTPNTPPTSGAMPATPRRSR